AEQVEHARALSARHGLPIVSVVCNHPKGNLLADGASAQTGVAETVRALEIASALGAGCILDTLGGLGPDLYYDQAWENAVRNLRSIAPHAARLNVRLGIEFVWNGFLFSPLEMRTLLETVASPQIGFYFDTA